jgi:uncharacterized protein (TIGR02246 family)
MIQYKASAIFCSLLTALSFAAGPAKAEDPAVQSGAAQAQAVQSVASGAQAVQGGGAQAVQSGGVQAVQSGGAQAGRPAAERPLTNKPDEEKAIRATVSEFVAAFNAGDAKKLMDLFTEDAEVVDENGEVVRGKGAIEANFTATFAENPGIKIVIEIEALRFVTADAALERGRTITTIPGDPVPETGTYTVLYVKQNGRWLQSLVRDDDRPSTPHDRLKELEWMIGTWVDESDEGKIHTTCRWSEDKNFLIREFKVELLDKTSTTGEQRIGWDPIRKQIRSWSFASDGGHGEAYWTRDGDRTLVKFHLTTGDGVFKTGTQVIEKVNSHVVKWKIIDRTIGGRAVADSHEFTLVREPPAPPAR